MTFETGSSKLSEEGKRSLDRIARVARDNDSYVSHINVEGYTDYTGSSKTNLALSEARAVVVREYLLSQGVDGNKVTAKGFGESKIKFGWGAPKSVLSGERKAKVEVVPVTAIE